MRKTYKCYSQHNNPRKTNSSTRHAKRIEGMDKFDNYMKTHMNTNE